MQIECCGVYGAEVHTVTAGRGGFERPLCVGHEVVCQGRQEPIMSIEEGDHVGVGTQIWACLQCDAGNPRNGNHCPHMVGT